MFTFGRENELKHAINFVGNPEKAAFLTDVINAVHDLLENIISEQAAIDIFAKAFCEGKSGIWESTGSWLRKLGGEYPEVLGLWETLAKHKSATVRYRVACHLNDLPESTRLNIVGELVDDKSKKVKSMMEARLEEQNS